jgi:hypothetical protein
MLAVAAVPDMTTSVSGGTVATWWQSYDCGSKTSSGMVLKNWWIESFPRTRVAGVPGGPHDQSSSAFCEYHDDTSRGFNVRVKR